MAKLLQFWKGRTKPSFSEKVQRGDHGKFFKNRQKSYLRLKGPKALWGKWHYPQISMILKCKDWTRFWRRRGLQKCPNGRVISIFARSPYPAFSEKVQRGDQRKFFKNRPKSSLRLKGPKALCDKWHYPLISIHLKCKNWRRLRRKQRLQKCPNDQVMGIFARSPKTRIF